MFLLCFDIGNTLAKLAVFEDNRMIHFRTVEFEDYSLFSDVFDSYKFDAVILSSVSNVPDQLIRLLKESAKIFLMLDHQTRVPIDNQYETKETLGKDRLAAVIGASFLYPDENLLVIDAGTAITYDIINSNLQYLGGNISPGIQMRYKALHDFTSKLPLIDRAQDYSLYGKNTHEAINSGVLQGIVAETDGTIDLFRKHFPKLRIVFTGGDSGLFDKKLKNTIFVVPNLVLIGLNRVLQYNIKNAKS